MVRRSEELMCTLTSDRHCLTELCSRKHSHKLNCQMIRKFNVNTKEANKTRAIKVKTKDSHTCDSWRSPGFCRFPLGLSSCVALSLQGYHCLGSSLQQRRAQRESRVRILDIFI